MPLVKKHHPIFILMLSAWLSACSNLQSKSNLAELADNALLSLPKQWQSQSDQQNLQITAQEQSLLQLVNNQSQLADLIKLALDNNFDLQRSAIRLKISHLQNANSAAANQPNLDLTLNPSKTKGASSSTALALNLNWELDIWGRIADLSSANSSNQQALLLDYSQAKTSLVARLIQQWSSLQSQLQVLTHQRQHLASLVSVESITRQRYRDGTALLNDLKVAQTTVLRAQADIQQRAQLAQQTLRQINLLLNRNPQQPIAAIATQLTVAPPNLATPLSVMRARPDINAALQRIRAADSRYAVAQKTLLPSFKLSAGLSNSGSGLSDLLSSSTVYNLLGNLSAPIYQAGRLRNDIAISDLERNISYKHFRHLLLLAVKEVDNRLSKEQSLNNQLQHLNRAHQQLADIEQSYKQRYSDGLLDILLLLEAQQNYFNSQIQLTQLRHSQMHNRIELALALGLGLKPYTGDLQLSLPGK